MSEAASKSSSKAFHVLSAGRAFFGVGNIRHYLLRLKGTHMISLVGYSDVYAAKHRKDMIYVGRDQAMPVHWSVYVNGEWEQIDDARTLKEAKERGHLQFDRGSACSLKLNWRSDWHLVDGTRSSSANACPECGNPVTDDVEDESALRCPDCGWEHVYTLEEIGFLKARDGRATRWHLEH